MIRKMATYKIRKENLERVKEAIREFVEAIDKNEPDTIYDAYQADDGLTFIHLALFPDEPTEQVHRKAEYTDRFVEVLYPCCDELPQFTDLRLIKAAGEK